MKATLDSQNLVIGDALIMTSGNSSNGNNAFEEGSKKECGIAKKQISSKTRMKNEIQVARTSMVMKVYLVKFLFQMWICLKRKRIQWWKIWRIRFQIESISFPLSFLDISQSPSIELLAQFLYNAVQEDDIGYLACLICVDNVTIGNDLYVSRHFNLFAMCSQCYVANRRIMAMGHYLLGRPWGVGLGNFEK